MRYESPTTVEAAVTLLANEAGKAHILAGGTDLLVRLRSGFIEPDLIVDLKRIDALKSITMESDGLRVGAAVPSAMLNEHADAVAGWPGVCEAASLIGSTQVQGRATISGNLCNASPAADSVPEGAKARAVSWVLFGGVLAGFLGPRLASTTSEALPGHAPAEAANAIQWHIVAMFAPSFVTGEIVKRLGTHLTAAIGMLLIIGSVGTALMGTSTVHFDLGLVLLGVGWNFGFISSTVMLTKSYRPEEGAKVQALNEQLVFGSNAIGSIGAGLALNFFGWEAVNLIALPIALATILLLGWDDLRTRRIGRQQAVIVE